MPDMTVQRRLRHCELEPLPYHWDAPPFGGIQERIGEDLRGCLEVPTDLPHQLLTLLMQLGRDGEGGRSAAERPRLRRETTRALEERTMQQTTKGRTRKPSVNRKVQLASGAELKNWADIGPRSVAAAARYRQQPRTEQESGAARPGPARRRREG